MAYQKKTQQALPLDSKFVPKCKCPDANCNAEEMASKVERLFADGHNSAIAVVAQLKEMSAALGAVPGLRAATGGVLLILETIGAMNDNVAAFDQLASQAIDNCLLLLSCLEVIDASSPVAGKAKDQIDSVAHEFYKIMEHIARTMKALNSRGRIRRYVFAKADKNDLDKHRSAMTHLINKFQIVLQTANLARAGGGGDHSGQVKTLTEQQIHAFAEGYKTIIVERAKEEYDKQVAEYHNSPQLNLNANANFNAGAGSTITNSGNVSTKVISGQNDYSNHTSTINITNGDLRPNDYPSSRGERRSRRSSPSDDSDEEYTPRARREERNRRSFEPDGYRY